MIKHIVLWKFADSAEGNSKEDNIKLVEEGLLALPAFIPQIKHLEFVRNTNPTDRNSDAALITEFDSYEDLNMYTIHPEHVKVAKFVGSVVTARGAIDYDC